MSVNHFGDVQYLIGEHLADLLPADLPLILAVQVDELEPHRPHLPRDALGLERPAAALLLEELQADLARAAAVVAAQQLREARYLPLDGAVEVARRAAHVREVDEVAVNIRVADCAHRVAAFGVVHELTQRTVEQHRVEDARDRFVHLTPLDGQLKYL